MISQLPESNEIVQKMKKIIVSVHDVTPRFTHELEEIFSELDRLGVTVRSELVVPNFQRQYKLEDHPDFIAMLKEHHSQGIDVSLHGIYHDYAEFYRFDYAAANDALHHGLQIFEKNLQFAPAGFVAPQWLQSRGSLKAVRENNFAYTATLTGVHYQNGLSLRAIPFNYDWGMIWVDHLITFGNGLRSRLRCNGVIRFSLHPMDIPDRMLAAELRQLRYLLDHGWEPTSYQQMGQEMTNGRK